VSEIVVLDTHIWLWWVNDKNKFLSVRQIACIEEYERVAISIISCFEIAQLVKRGRLKLALPVFDWIEQALTPAGIESLNLSPGIFCQAVELTEIHKDPFDRMIISTALHSKAKLMSVDGHFELYPELHGHLINT